MKKVLHLLCFAVLFTAGSSVASAQKVEDEIEIKTEGTKITIKINDPKAAKYDLLIYKTYEEIMYDEYGLTQNPISIDITGWLPAVYHIKIDYGFVTQFRHYEVLKD